MTAHRKLESLAADGYVTKTKVAGFVVWMPTDKTPTFDDTGDLRDDERVDADGGGSGGDSGGDSDDDGGGRSWREDRLSDGRSE